MQVKKSLREIKNDNARAMRNYMKLAGKPIPDDPLFAEVDAKPRQQRKTQDMPTEHQEQVAFVRWFRLQFPTVKIFAIPNAAVRDERQAAWMKAEGLTAGVPDLCIPAWRLWIEMKRQKGGVVSPDQAEWIAYLNMHGQRAVVCRGFDDAVRQVKEFAFNGAAPASVASGTSRPMPAPPFSSREPGASCKIVKD